MYRREVRGEQENQEEDGERGRRGGEGKVLFDERKQQPALGHSRK